MTLKRKKEIDTSQEEVALGLIHKGAIVEVFKLSDKSGGQASVSVKLMLCTRCYRGYLYCSFPKRNKEKGKKERVYSFPVDVLRSHFKK